MGQASDYPYQGIAAHCFQAEIFFFFLMNEISFFLLPRRRGMCGAGVLVHVCANAQVGKVNTAAPLKTISHHQTPRHSRPNGGSLVQNDNEGEAPSPGSPGAPSLSCFLTTDADVKHMASMSPSPTEAALSAFINKCRSKFAAAAVSQSAVARPSDEKKKKL